MMKRQQAMVHDLTSCGSWVGEVIGVDIRGLDFFILFDL